MANRGQTFEEWVEQRWLFRVQDEPVDVLRGRIASHFRTAHPDSAARAMVRPRPRNRHFPAKFREEAPEYFDKLVQAHVAYGNIVVALPDGSCLIFSAGTPPHWMERRASPYLEFADYHSWRAYNCHYWPTSLDGQEEARSRTAAVWATRPEPYWSVLHPPFYYAGYSPIDNWIFADKHAEYQRLFREERRSLGDIILDDRAVFAIGTPQLIVDRESQRAPSAIPSPIAATQYLS